MFIPKSDAAVKALNALTVPRSPVVWYDNGRTIDPAALREMLLSLTCPVPCVGVVDSNGWHTSCLTRVENALEELELDPLLAAAPGTLDLPEDEPAQDETIAASTATSPAIKPEWVQPPDDRKGWGPAIGLAWHWRIFTYLMWTVFLPVTLILRLVIFGSMFDRDSWLDKFREKHFG